MQAFHFYADHSTTAKPRLAQHLSSARGILSQELSTYNREDAGGYSAIVQHEPSEHWDAASYAIDWNLRNDCLMTLRDNSLEHLSNSAER